MEQSHFSKPQIQLIELNCLPMNIEFNDADANCLALKDAVQQINRILSCSRCNVMSQLFISTLLTNNNMCISYVDALPRL